MIVWHIACMYADMIDERIVVPEPDEVRLAQTPSGRVVLRQNDQLVTIPRDYVVAMAFELSECAQNTLPQTTPNGS